MIKPRNKEVALQHQIVISLFNMILYSFLRYSKDKSVFKYPSFSLIGDNGAYFSLENFNPVHFNKANIKRVITTLAHFFQDTNMELLQKKILDKQACIRLKLQYHKEFSVRFFDKQNVKYNLDL